MIDSTDVFVHIHRENATCRTRVYLVANRNPCKSDHSFRVEYTNFVKNSIIVNPHRPSSSTLSTNCFVDDFDCLWSECFSCIPFWNCLHFFDRSLSLETDFWSFTFCRLLPRWGRVVWKAMSSSFYAVLYRRSVCTTLLNFNLSTFISLANCHWLLPVL